MTKLEMPEFKTEGEEAAWWFNNQDALMREYFEKHPGALPNEFRYDLGLMVDYDDIHLAFEQAERRGLLLEDYLRQLLHEALVLRE